LPLDALCLTALKEELSQQLADMKIDKVQQPARDMLIFAMRGKSASNRLLISAGSGDMRIHLTQHKHENPDAPPMFCMLLRKHLVGARLISIFQPPAERVLELIFDAPDALGVRSEKRLVIELIAQSSNIILVDSDGIIMDCLRRVGGALSDKRAVLPGLMYHRPEPQQGKLNPLETTPADWDAAFNTQLEKNADKWIQSAFFGFSPLICREIVWRAYKTCDQRLDVLNDHGEALKQAFFEIVEIVQSGRFEPWSIYNLEHCPRDFSYVKIGQYEQAMLIDRAESFSQLLDDHYTKISERARQQARASATLKTVKTARERILRKLIAQQAELEKTALREGFRECGDIITANMHRMSKGQDVLLTEDFFSESGGERVIKLDPLKTPQQNAAKYYKDYTKLRNAERFLTEQISLGQREADYLESVLETLALAEGEKGIEEIRRELMTTGYIKDKRSKAGKVKTSSAAVPMKFLSSTGMQILAGRNNVQNDQLTLKSALKSDMWLHTQKIHGSHVVISCKGSVPDDVTLREAAAIAAYYSAARSSGKVSVDYTLVKNVKKPSGSRPGMVIYTGFRTVLVAPDEGLVNALRV